MTERRFDTAYWSNPFVMKLPAEAKLLYSYLWTNLHCNQAGLYEIATETISFETGIAMEDIPKIMQLLEPKVIWYPKQNLVWVKNFLRHQSRSPSFLEAAAKNLNGNIPEELKSEFLLHNQDFLRGIPIGGRISLTRRECVLIRDAFCCQYCGQEINDAADYEMDHIIPVSKGGKDNYLNLVASCRSCSIDKLDKTPAEAGMKEPQPSSFHASQALYMLKNNADIKRRWLEVFPARESIVDSMLINVDQHQSILSKVDAEDASRARASTSTTSSLSSSYSNSEVTEEIGVVKGKDGGESAEPAAATATEQVDSETLEGSVGAAVTAEVNMIEFLETLEGWRKGRADDLAWLRDFRRDWPGFTLPLAKACRDYHSGKGEPRHKGVWKNRFRNWIETEGKRNGTAGGIPRLSRTDGEDRTAKYTRGKYAHLYHR